MSSENWKNIYIINKQKEKLFCHCYVTSNDAPNILYIQTPVVSVYGMAKKAYEPLSKYKFNIFAVDLSGIGNSEGDIRNISISKIVEDLDSCIDYIKENFNEKIFLFAGTGLGGILGQYYASYSDKLYGFAQFGVGIYKDLSPMKIPIWFAKSMNLGLKIVNKINPNVCFYMTPPKYYGKNKDQDDDFYKMALLENPNMFLVNINFFITIMDIFLGSDSYIKEQVKSPVLVFQTLSDRYFEAQYFKYYYDKLTCKKRIYTVDDTHNSYYFRSDEFCEQVGLWFLDIMRERKENA